MKVIDILLVNEPVIKLYACRFTKDIDVVDVTIPQNIRAFIWCALVVVATLIIISRSTPWFILIVIPLGFLYFFIQV